MVRLFLSFNLDFLCWFLLLLLLVREESVVLVSEFVELGCAGCAPEHAAMVESCKLLERPDRHHDAWHEHTLRTSHRSLARLKK